MAAPGQLLYAALTSNPETSALLGTRVMPNRLPAGTTLPAAVYQLVNRQPRARTRRNCVLSDEARLQVTLYAASYAGLEQLASAVRKVLDSPARGFVYDNERDQYDEASQIGGRSQDYILTLPLTS
jgi:hypothetical protein